MRFEEALNAACDQEQLRQKPNVKFAVEKKTAKTLAFFWNMVAIAGGKLDDLVFIDDNMNINSKPFKMQKEKPEKPVKEEKAEKDPAKTKKKGRKKSSAKTAEKDVLNDDNNAGPETS